MAALPLRAVEVAPGAAGVAAVRDALSAHLDGDHPPFAPVPTPSRHVSEQYARTVRTVAGIDRPVEQDDVAAVLTTSGSTGRPRGVLITRDNLVAASEAAWAHVPGLHDCAWVIAIPVTSIGGFVALARAVLGGGRVHALDSVGGAIRFSPDELADCPVDGPFAISLVPTQLADVLTSPAATRWLSSATAVIVGAARTPTDLADRARDAGIPLITTYGMTESTGGCVYDGVPLPGVGVEVESGRIALSGRVIAAGYRLDPQASDASFSGSGAARRFITSDVGEWSGGHLRVEGRVDDVISVRGVKVSVGAVESAVRAQPGVQEAAVVVRADERAGALLVAFIVTDDGITADSVATGVGHALGGSARPRIVQVDELPHLANGKIDRLALTARANDR